MCTQYETNSTKRSDVWSFDRKTYTWSSRKSSHSWNPADFTMKSDVSAKTLLILQGLGWISWNLLDFIRISWNPVDFMWNRKTFARNCNSMFGLSKERPILDHHAKAHIPWNPADFMKSSGFHMDFIQISWNLADFRWNLVDFTMKSGGFHHEIWWISGEIQWISWNLVDFRWNPVDFTQISPVKSTQNYKSKCFSKNSSVWWMQGGGFHPWNPMDFTHEIWQISPRFDLWNPPKIIKASVLAKTLQFDECRVGDFTLEIWWISPWNLVDFNL